MKKLGIVIPTLDEEATLGRLLADLAAQTGVDITLAVADGGSRDNTRAIFYAAAAGLPFETRWIDAPRGRGAQMNAGAKALECEYLLFLHADSHLPDREQLVRSLETLKEAEIRGVEVAGHFGLSFEINERDGFYYFFEAKTRTGMAGTVNGDQGLLLPRSFFESLGGFSERLPYLEDALIERRIRDVGRLILLPGSLVTSARRFEVEGRVARQVVNSFIRAFEYAGEGRFVSEAAKVYGTQSTATGLRLLPFFGSAHLATLGKGYSGWFRLWYRVGAFVRSNAWQLPFMVDCAIDRRRGHEPGEGPFRLTRASMPLFDFITDNPVGRVLAALLTGIVFYGVMSILKVAGEDDR